MNKEEILSEGYLTAYLTGDLDREQTAETERWIAKDQDVRQEYLTLQKSLELLSFNYSLEASPLIKKRIMEHPVVTKHVGIRDHTYHGAPKLLIAASVIVTLASLFLAFFFWQQWKSTDTRLMALTARNLQLTESYHTVNQELTDVREDLAVLINPAFKRIILGGTENAPNANAVVYWNPKAQEIYLNSANLQQLDTDQQYQLWALIDGNPVDAGVFDAETGTFQIMNGIEQADAFAVTIEPRGGSQSPTLSTMQVFARV